MAVTQLVRGTQLKPGTVKTLVYNAATTGVMSDLAAITASRALASDANGLPVASATTATELGYVSGVTSAIQTQINALTSGLSWKTSSRVATTVAGGNIAGFAAGTITVVVDDNANYFPTNLSGIKVDGVFLAVNDRVVVKNQTAPAENGIYTVTAIGERVDADPDVPAVLVRASDMNVWAEVPAAATFVEVGTVNADLGFVCTSDQGGTINVTAITFVQFSTYAAGITQLTSDVTAGPGSGSVAATVVSVGGSSAANVNAAELLANAATDANTGSAIVKRSAGGNFSAGTITAALTGAASLNLLLTGGTLTGALTINPITNQLVLGGVSAGTTVTITSPAPASNRILTIPIATGNRNFLLSGEAAIVDADINASAAIAVTKLAAVTANKVLLSDASGFVSASSVSNTTLGYLDATSSIQTQLNTKLAASNFVIREVPTGAIPGTVYTTANTVVANTECVYLNGLLQQGGGADYTFSSTNTITFVNTTVTGDLVLVNYQK